MTRIPLFALLLALVATPALGAQVTETQTAKVTTATIQKAKAQKIDRQAWRQMSRTERRARSDAKRAARTVAMQKRRAEQQKRRAEAMTLRDARKYRQLRMPGDQVRVAATRLATELTWHDDLSAAQRVAKRNGKPILWIQTLGDLEGLL